MIVMSRKQLENLLSTFFLNVFKLFPPHFESKKDKKTYTLSRILNEFGNAC
jgi:hypothetical protein